MNSLLEPPEDPEDFPSNEKLAELPPQEQVQALREWFYWNFEDPAEITPYETREGGYQYIWGGPFDAHDALASRFEGIVEERRVSDLATDLSRDNWQWAPNSRRIRDWPSIYS